MKGEIGLVCAPSTVMVTVSAAEAARSGQAKARTLAANRVGWRCIGVSGERGLRLCGRLTFGGELGDDARGVVVVEHGEFGAQGVEADEVIQLRGGAERGAIAIFGGGFDVAPGAVA